MIQLRYIIIPILIILYLIWSYYSIKDLNNKEKSKINSSTSFWVLFSVTFGLYLVTFLVIPLIIKYW